MQLFLYYVITTNEELFNHSIWLLIRPLFYLARTSVHKHNLYLVEILSWSWGTREHSHLLLGEQRGIVCSFREQGSISFKTYLRELTLENNMDFVWGEQWNIESYFKETKEH